MTYWKKLCGSSWSPFADWCRAEAAELSHWAGTLPQSRIWVLNLCGYPGTNAYKLLPKGAVLSRVKWPGTDGRSWAKLFWCLCSLQCSPIGRSRIANKRVALFQVTAFFYLRVLWIIVLGCEGELSSSSAPSRWTLPWSVGHRGHTYTSCQCQCSRQSSFAPANPEVSIVVEETNS